jgi:GWxTD domain-containing protein
MTLLTAGCFMFRSGHLRIPAGMLPVYEEGLARYRAGDYGAAEQRFRTVVEADNRAVLPRYWLGLALCQQGKQNEAARHFQQIRVISRKLPHGYYGLGLVALRARHRKFEAIQWFREALRQDPGFLDARWQLALTRLALSKGLFGVFAMRAVRQEFRRVIELDPSHPEAYYTLGSTYYAYGSLDDAEPAIPLFEQQIAVNPDHQEARYQLGLAYIDVDRIPEGVAMLESVSLRDPARTEQVNRSIAEARLRNRMVDGDSVFIVLTMLPERERRLYYDLATILPPGQAEDVHTRSIQEAERIAYGYWKAHDPDPATPGNDRLVEHCRRVAYARRYFGRGLWPWDRRGEVYIRYGEPVSRETYTADVAAPSGADAGAPQFGIRQVERWVYHTPPLQFEFVDQGSTFVFDTPLVPATGDIASLAEAAVQDQGAAMDETAARTPSVYRDEVENGPPLRFSYSLAVFRGADGRPELEVDYAVPARELAFEDRAASLETAVVLYDSTWRETARATEEKRITAASDDDRRRYEVALYRRTMPVTPGEHHFALHITDRRSRRAGLSRQPLTVGDFPPGALAMSDIRLVSQVQEGAAGVFVRGGRRLIPNPAAVFSYKRPVTLYFEVYNLVRGADGRTRLSIEYTVFPLSGAERPVIAAAGASAARQEQGREFAILQEEEGTQETLFRDIALDMSRAKPGRYALQVTVTDLHRQEAVDKTVLFRLVE